MEVEKLIPVIKDKKSLKIKKKHTIIKLKSD